MEHHDWAWLAGLFEGEGCITFTGKNSVALTIGMTDRDVVDRCRELTGVGTVYLCATNRPRPMWVWQTSKRDEVLFLLEHLRPWFGERRSQKAALAMERVALIRKPGHCKRGHPMSGDNLYVAPGCGQRICRACAKVREAARPWRPDLRRGRRRSSSTSS